VRLAVYVMHHAAGVAGRSARACSALHSAGAVCSTISTMWRQGGRDLRRWSSAQRSWQGISGAGAGLGARRQVGGASQTEAAVFIPKKPTRPCP
jgi:hypothetical protein